MVGLKYPKYPESIQIKNAIESIGGTAFSKSVFLSVHSIFLYLDTLEGRDTFFQFKNKNTIYKKTF